MTATRAGTSSIRRGLLALLLLAPLAAPAQTDLGSDYQNAMARGDYNAVAAALRPLADQGNPEAQFRYAMLYAEGLGLRTSDALAASWLRRAADQGHAEAQYQLGRMYLDGRGVPMDRREAVGWLTKAADAGSAPARSLLQRISPGR